MSALRAKINRTSDGQVVDVEVLKSATPLLDQIIQNQQTPLLAAILGEEDKIDQALATRNATRKACPCGKPWEKCNWGNFKAAADYYIRLDGGRK